VDILTPSIARDRRAGLNLEKSQVARTLLRPAPFLCDRANCHNVPTLSVYPQNLLSYIHFDTELSNLSPFCYIYFGMGKKTDDFPLTDF
jgi:hypothetical protein